jgi:3'(2'), 5'-bisphosphate nucleotidase
MKVNIPRRMRSHILEGAAVLSSLLCDCRTVANASFAAQKRYGGNVPFFHNRFRCGAGHPLAHFAPLNLAATATDVTHKATNEMPEDLSRREDVMVALVAVRNACRVTEILQPEWDENDGKSSSNMKVSKADLSPVTVADFAVQGLILKMLNDTFPGDGFIAEEDSTALQTDDLLCQRVASSASLNPKEVMDAIDLGKSYQQWSYSEKGMNPSDTQNARPSRVWVLDPIDGTRGFLRGRRSGGQYAIALALIENGVPVIGILGCPNLPVDVDDDRYEWQDGETHLNNRLSRGCIFVASRGGGCYQLFLDPPTSSATNGCRRLHVTSDRSTQDARFCIGVERYSDALGQCAGMAQYIHGPDRALDPVTGEILRSRRMDSQAKHGVIARGGAELYVRLPKAGYVEWIWDHAAGNVVIEEAGGAMTDAFGRPIDFSLGAQLSPDIRGVLMSSGAAFHKVLVEAFASVESATSCE